MRNLIFITLISCISISLAQYGGSSYGLGAGASNYVNPLSSGYGLGGYGLGANPYGSLSAPGYGKTGPLKIVF